jgi:hypothetical protein
MPDIGYVVVDLVLDDRGSVLESNSHGTLDTFLRATQAELSRWKFSPGRRDGKGVNTATTFAVVFSPAAAAENEPNAVPRLLAVDVVRLPRPREAKPNEIFEDRVVMVDLTVDETGRATRVKNVPTDLGERAAMALKNWKFAPARRSGQPMPAEIQVPLVVVTAGGRPPGEKQTQPNALRREPPVYPLAMRTSGMRG